MFKKILLLILISTQSLFAQNNTNSFLDYISSFSSMSADFTQIIEDNKLGINQKSYGKIWIQKPACFKWKVDGSDGQLMTADGKTLTIYDKSLDQVIHQAVPTNLAEAPYLVLLTGNADVLNKMFDIKLESKDNYVLTPINSQGGLITNINISFLDGKLSTITIHTQTGQSTRIIFSNISYDKIDKEVFNFVAPKDAAILSM